MVLLYYVTLWKFQLGKEIILKYLLQLYINSPIYNEIVNMFTPIHDYVEWTINKKLIHQSWYLPFEKNIKNKTNQILVQTVHSVKIQTWDDKNVMSIHSFKSLHRVLWSRFSPTKSPTGDWLVEYHIGIWYSDKMICRVQPDATTEWVQVWRHQLSLIQLYVWS